MVLFRLYLWTKIKKYQDKKYIWSIWRWQILNLEKNWAIQIQINLRKVVEKIVKHQGEITQKLYQFYAKLFSKRIFIFDEDVANYLKKSSVYQNVLKKKWEHESEIIKNETKDALRNMKCNKTTGKNGVTK